MAATTDVICPKCGAAVPLSEAIARPLLEAERKKIEKEAQERATNLGRREEEVEKKRQALAETEKQLKKQQTEVDRIVDERLRAERETLTQEAIKRTSSSYDAKLQAVERELAESRSKLIAAERLELETIQQRQTIESEKRNLELTVSRRVSEEREKIREEVLQEQTQRFQAQLTDKDRALTEKDIKLREAQQAELVIRKERQALQEQKHELELQVERRVDDERRKIRESTQKEEQETHRLKLAEKDKVIEDMRKQVEEMRRRSEQGSPQLQGEVAELDLEAVLRSAFYADQFEAVAPGRPGGDLIQTVIGSGGKVCGKILWERKRTKDWNKDWISKNKADQRAIGAHVGAIITLTAPKGVDTFDQLEGVWVATSSCTVPLAKALRQTLVETANAKRAEQDREGKMDIVYAYVTGQQFRQRVQAICEAYIAMRKDLDAEKRAITKLWAKRETQLGLLLTGTAGVYGDLQGIVGKSLPEIEPLKLPGGEGMLTAPPLEFTESEEDRADKKENPFEF